MAVQGAGFLIAANALADISFDLYQNPADTTIAAFISGGVAVASAANIYAGAQLIFGLGTISQEVATVTAVNGTNLTVPLVNGHSIGDKVFAPTFPSRQPTDPLFTQSEMLAYLSTACNDFLTEVPLVYAINESVNVSPTQQDAPLPTDSMEPERIAFWTPNGPYPLRETSQANLDGYDYRWQAAAPAAQPTAYFRDKMPTQYFGIWPRVNVQSVYEVVYKQRQVPVMGLLDGFLFPDPFVPIVKFKVLAAARSKDGEMRNPGLAKLYQTKYDFGVKIAKMVLDSVMDPNLEMADTQSA